MAKKDFDQLVKLRQELKQHEDRLDKLRSEICTRRVTDTVRGSNPSFPYSARVFKLEGAVELEGNRQINREIARQREILIAFRVRCAEQIMRCEQEIFAVNDSVTRQALMLYYIDGFSWKATARRMGYSDEGTPRKICKKYFDKK